MAYRFFVPKSLFTEFFKRVHRFNACCRNNQGEQIAQKGRWGISITQCLKRCSCFPAICLSSDHANKINTTHFPPFTRSRDHGDVIDLKIEKLLKKIKNLEWVCFVGTVRKIIYEELNYFVKHITRRDVP